MSSEESSKQTDQNAGSKKAVDAPAASAQASPEQPKPSPADAAAQLRKYNVNLRLSISEASEKDFASPVIREQESSAIKSVEQPSRAIKTVEETGKTSTPPPEKN